MMIGLKRVIDILNPADPPMAGRCLADAICGDLRGHRNWPVNSKAEGELVGKIVDKSREMIATFAEVILPGVGFEAEDIERFRESAIGSVQEILTRKTLH